MKHLLVLCLLLSSISCFAQSKDEAAIRQVLAKQAEGWNKGSIDEYMQGYLNSDSLVFVGKNGPTYGYAETAARYKKSYSDTAAMGKLAFDILQVKELSPKYYFVLGKWHLKRSAGDLAGSFTLLFQKIGNRWYIVADHSS